MNLRRIDVALRSGATLAAALAVTAVPVGAADVPLNQAFDLRVPVAPVPVPVAGFPRLVYELHLTNFSANPLEPLSLEVRDAGTGAGLARFAGNDLEMRIQHPGGSSHGPAVPAGAVAIVYIELDSADPPETLMHRLAYRPPGETSAYVAIEGAEVRVSTDQPVLLGPPLRGGPWAAVYHPAWERGHRRFIYAVAGRAVIPGRYAIDWIKLDGDGRSAAGDPDRVPDWHGYGAEVLAVADAVVAVARDDVPESETVSGQPRHPLEDATGNYVALDLGDGRYAFYEHLKPGSIRVAAGDRVARGERIAELGFTGHSTGPHLHFHIADGPSSLGSEGVPFVLDAFEAIGRYEKIEDLGRAGWSPTADGAGGQRREERPAPNAVVRFP